MMDFTRSLAFPLWDGGLQNCYSIDNVSHFTVTHLVLERHGSLVDSFVHGSLVDSFKLIRSYDPDLKNGLPRASFEDLSFGPATLQSRSETVWPWRAVWRRVVGGCVGMRDGCPRGATPGRLPAVFGSGEDRFRAKECVEDE